MAIIQGNAKQGSTRGFYPKVINGSLRFNDNDSAYLSWTPASAGNRKTFTWSGWIKRGNINTDQYIWEHYADANTRQILYFNNSNNQQLNVFSRVGGTNYQVQTSQLFRDPSAWYHIVVAVDTTQATAADRVKIYVNGSLITDLSSTSYPPQNSTLAINGTGEFRHGSSNSGSSYFDGYLANVHFIDGQALTASDFGETKNGVWVAKDYAGTFGTNGFYLTFEDDTQVEAFNTVLWSGNGVDNTSITGFGFAPDLVIQKVRTHVDNFNVFDTVRGAGKAINTNLTDAEFTTSHFKSFDSDGFTVSNDSGYNGSGRTYVAWGWKAGDSNVSNTDGTITSTVRANDTYGFSIVSYTGTGANGTVGHGLSSAPDFIITKNRDSATNWYVGHSDLDATSPWSYRLILQDTDARGNEGAAWNDTAPTTSVFSVGTSGATNGNTNNMIAYCWSETTGYSKFGSYTANNSTNGPEVDCGFKPAFVMVKHTTKTEQWIIFDATRETTNDRSARLFPAISNAESNIPNDQGIRFLSTAEGDAFSGFKITVAGGYGINDNDVGDQYIYAAFADTREAAFWLDQSGNDNDWQPVNLDHNDTVADSPTDNFATWNPLENGSATFADGNLVVTTSTTSGKRSVGTTILFNSGQYYCEIECNTNGSSSAIIGIANDDFTIGNEVNNDSWAYYNTGQKYIDGSASSYGASWGAGDVIGVAFDADAGTLEFFKNGTSQGTITGVPSDTYRFVVGGNSSLTASKFTANFGQQPFKYDPPA